MSPTADGFAVLDRGPVRTVQAARLARLPGITHAFGTRLGAPPGTARSVALEQVHGARVVDVGAAARAVSRLAADAVVARRAQRAHGPCTVRTADCVPLLLADREGTAVAAVHAGWRGVAAGIGTAAVAALERLDVPAARLVAALGPAIGACCYRVGEDVARSVAAASGAALDDVSVTAAEGHRRLDLRAALARQLEGAGLAPRDVAVAPWCTCCNPALFFSYRRDGAHAGRMISAIGWESALP